MKYLFFLVFICTVSLIYAQDGVEIVQFDQLTHELGKIKKGDKIKGSFSFKNISSEPVQIDLVSTCECTAATWTKSKIKPGESGVIDYIFDSNLKDEEEPVDIDVYFINTNPKTTNPYSVYLQYTFRFKE